MPLLRLAQVILAGWFCFSLGAASVLADQVPGKFGAGVDFRKTPLRVKALAEYSQTPLTVECFVKLNSDKKRRYNVLLSHLSETSAGHWEIYTTPLDGRLTVRLGGATPTLVPSFVRITDDRWHFLSVCFESGRTTIALDGRTVAARQAGLKVAKQPIPGELFVGTDFSDSKSVGFSGIMDELRLSHAVREQNHVPQKAFAVDKETVGLWHFDEAIGNTHRDSSPHGNSLAYSPGIESAWTPRSATRPDAPDWEKETDDDWKDGRFNEMQKGPVVGCSLSVPGTPIPRQPRYVPKGLAVRQGNATTLFDKSRLQLVAGWTGGFVRYGDRRFGLIDHPEPVGTVQFSMREGSDWEPPDETIELPQSKWSPLPTNWGQYAGFYRHGERVIHQYTVGQTEILDSPGRETIGGKTFISRTIEVGPANEELTLNAFQAAGERPAPKREIKSHYQPGFDLYRLEMGNSWSGVILLYDRQEKKPQTNISSSQFATVQDSLIQIHIKPRSKPIRFRSVYLSGTEAEWTELEKAAPKLAGPDNLTALTQGGPGLWNTEVTTKGVLGKDDSAFAVDTLTLPFENPYKSIFYVTGLGFLPDKRLAISTIYGDVWLVDGLSGDLSRLRWKRFASGLYQPMGLVIKEGEILVLERGQITRLRDLNHDDEADFYENYYDGWQTTGAGHAYDTGLKLAPDGSLFFFKGQSGGGEPSAESGCLVRVLPDGKSHEVFATGFRHPIGLGMSPEGIVTGADQQGNWMPATRIDRYRRGGFYGDMRTHHRKTPPKTFDPPTCWLPRDVDNSAGGQIWVPSDRWGALGGKTLHLSWGRCRLFHLLHEEVDGVWQGGVVPLPCESFASGPITGAFSPDDGHLYVVGLHGWQTAGEQDGCLQRVRYTGATLNLPIELHAYDQGIEITFSDPLDPETATNPDNYTLERWNYRWSEAYGSDHWSVSDPDQQRHDPVQVRSVTLGKDQKTVFLRMEDMQPVMQMKLAYRLKSRDGTAFSNTIHHTVHRLRPGDK